MSPTAKPLVTLASAEPTARARLDGLVDRYYAPLLSFFRKRTRDASETQDLVQQVFLRLAQYGEAGGVQNPDGYIFRTAANTLNDHLRQQMNRERLVGESRMAASVCEPVASPERLVAHQEGVARLAAALRELPERTRDIFVLRRFEGLKHGEIARLQGISERAVEKQVAKAVAYLSKVLDHDLRR